MLEFLKTDAGRAVMGVLIAVVLIIILDLNYRYFAKAFLDFIFAFIAVIICLPVLAIGAVISKIKAGKVLESKAYLGVKGKIVYIHSYAGNVKGIKNLPRLLDVICGKLSFVGVKLMEVSDGALMEDNQMDRFNARPGIICHLITKGDETLTYEEMFALDVRYAKRRELFTDAFIVLKKLVCLIRGEDKSYLGETKDKSFAEVLLARGVITETDFKRAQEAATEAISQT